MSIPSEIPNSALEPDMVPDPAEDMGAIDHFALTFDGYAHFGDAWGESLQRIRQRYEETGDLPTDLGDLRACLFLEQRRERFVWFGSDFHQVEEGVVEIREDPDASDRLKQAAFKRGLVGAIRSALSG